MRLATIPHSHPRWLVAVMLTALVVTVLNGFGLNRPQPGFGMSLGGGDAGYDRLIVVDDQAEQLAVYDAVDGRPLRHFDANATAAMLARHEDRLFVIAGDSTRSGPGLPQSRPVSASNH